MLKHLLTPAVIAGALGYFVDIYDIVLFSIVRTASLKDLGVPAEEMLGVGVRLLNFQMGGMLVGGIFWGVMGDKWGRLSVLFGSIFMYSLANVLNAFVGSIEAYSALRFIAGFGLAGELGAAITLVSEILPTSVRGYGTAIVAGVGVSGAVFASLVGDFFSWRIAYATGGGLGFLLLLFRIRSVESGLFNEVKQSQNIVRGSLWMLFSPRRRLVKFVSSILIGVPIWYAVSILVTFSPELGKALGATGPLSASQGILFMYAGLAVGDIGSGVISQKLRSRKKTVGGSLIALAFLIALYLGDGGRSPEWYYGLYFAMGVAAGYWAMFVTIAAENFGTNLRATVAIAVPNFVRGAVVLVTSLFHALSGSLGLVASAACIGALVLGVAAFGLSRLDETCDTDLNYLET